MSKWFKQLDKTSRWGFCTVLLLALAVVGSFAATQYSTKQPVVETLYVPIRDFDMSTRATVSVDGKLPAESVGVGGQLTEVSTRGYLALQMTTADDVRKVDLFPGFIDTRYNLGVRVHYASTSGDDDGGIVFKFAAIPTGLNSALTDISGTGAAGTSGYELRTLATDSSTTQYAWRTTRWDTIPRADMPYYNGKMWVQSLELDADGDASTDEILVLGIEYAFVRKNETMGYPDSLFIQAPTIGGVSKGGKLKK